MGCSSRLSFSSMSQVTDHNVWRGLYKISSMGHSRDWGFLNQLPLFIHYFIIQNQCNSTVLLNIAFLVDWCWCNLGAMKPVKYECDWHYLHDISQNHKYNGKINENMEWRTWRLMKDYSSWRGQKHKVFSVGIIHIYMWRKIYFALSTSNHYWI